MNAKTFAISLAAGIASVLALYAALQGGGLGVLLMSLVPLPIYVAALAWGTHAGVASSVVAIIAAATMIAPQVAVAVGLAITIPASIIGHQANLAQEDGSGGMEWFPISRLLFNLALILAVGIVLLGYFVNYYSIVQSPQFVSVLREQLDSYLAASPQQRPLTEEEFVQFTRLVHQFIPFVSAGLWVIVHVINIHLAGIICRSSNLLPRPKDDIPATANMPARALIIPVAAFSIAFLFGGSLGLVALVFAGTFTMAYSLVGLAGAHFRARTNPANLIFLILSYIFIMIALPVLFLFALGGVARSLTNSTTSPPPAGPNNT